jgi:hypothetical protein
LEAESVIPKLDKCLNVIKTRSDLNTAATNERKSNRSVKIYFNENDPTMKLTKRGMEYDQSMLPQK